MFSGKTLHIISFDIPYPPNYGGVIDVFYKVKALAALGVNVILHCWQYGDRKPNKELDKYCAEVHYYHRNKWQSPVTGSLPYIVKTRYSKALIQTINRDDHPVLFEGLHTTAPLYQDSLGSRKTFIRNHNIESDYYRNLGDKEDNFLKKQYFYKEAEWLKTYQEVMHQCDGVFAISPNDQKVLSKNFNTTYIPAFHSNEAVSIEEGVGTYCFYHGNLSVAENDEAAQYLVTEVFSKLSQTLIIGGNQASKKLRSLISKTPNVELKEQLSISEFDDLMRNAAINVLPTFQATGIKLKLLNALYKGRHCVVNSPMVDNTGLSPLCHVANTPEEFGVQIANLMQQPFNQDSIQKRKDVLERLFNNQTAAEEMAQIVFANN